MKVFWKAVYNFGVIPSLWIMFRIYGLFNKKVREGVKGRKRIFENLILDLAGINRTRKVIWFHSSSMGEFEQAKPIIEKLKKESGAIVFVTFFSPSGYRNSTKYPYIDFVSYLPFDKASSVKRFLRILKPDMVVIMRYDVWPNVIWALKSMKIPVFIVDATMRDDSKRFLPVIKCFHKSLFEDLTGILTVSERDAENYSKFNLPEVLISKVGDTRFDRVNKKSLDAKNKKILAEGVFRGKKVIIAGSTWEADEEVLIPVFRKLKEKMSDIVLILVPHEPTEDHIEYSESLLGEETACIRFSEMTNYKDEPVIIVDSIGILITLYNYAHIAYVGGSFRQGIHNVLEPAVYGVPVVFGPKISNSQEAIELVRIKGGFSVKNQAEAYRIFSKLLSDDELVKEAGNINESYVKRNFGATDKITSILNLYLK